MTILYSHDIILVLFQWIVKQDYKEKKKTGSCLSEQCRVKGQHNAGEVVEPQ